MSKGKQIVVKNFLAVRSCRGKQHGVDAIVVSTNTHSIGSDCHWLFISGHEEMTSDYRRYYPPDTQ